MKSSRTLPRHINKKKGKGKERDTSMTAQTNNKSNISKTNITTSQGDVEKISFPYLDWRVNPSDLTFKQDDPSHSLISPRVQRLQGAHVRYNNQSYYVYKELGRGYFGVVSLAQHIQTGEWIAIKEPHNPAAVNTTKVQSEADNLTKSDNLVFYDEYNSVIGMKLLEGYELYDTTLSNNRSPQKVSLLQKLLIAKNTLKYAADLHHDVKHIKGQKKAKEATIHRDIKGDNLYFTAECAVKYCDFGMAAQLDKEDKQWMPSNEEIEESRPTLGKKWDCKKGTPMFMAPEIYYAGDRVPIKYNESTEVYALGVTLAEHFNMVEVNPDDKERYLFNYNLLLPHDLNQLILAMVDDDTTERPTVVVANIILNTIFRDVGEKYSVNACVISIDDFCQLDFYEKANLVDAIISQDMNTIVLQGSDTTSHQDYYQTRYELINSGIIHVAPFMVKGQSQDAINHCVKDHYDGRLCTLNTEVFQYCHNQFVNKTTDALQVALTPNTSEIDNQIVSQPMPVSSPQVEKENKNHKKSKPGFFSRDSEYPLARDIIIGAAIGVTASVAIIVSAPVVVVATPYALIAGAIVAACTFIAGVVGSLTQTCADEEVGDHTDTSPLIDTTEEDKHVKHRRPHHQEMKPVLNMDWKTPSPYPARLSSSTQVLLPKTTANNTPSNPIPISSARVRSKY